MPKPKALSPTEARNTLVHRFGNKVNRLRQIAVRFGLNPYRVWLVWFQWDGQDVGEGTKREIKREEILPTPELAINNRLAWMNVGRVEEGQFVLKRVDPTLGEAMLSGKLRPGTTDNDECPYDGLPTSFLVLVKEDGRSGDDVVERWFTLSSMPYRRAGALDWDVQLTQVMQ